MDRAGAANSTRTGRDFALLETLLLALGLSGLWYFVYYLSAPWIWSQNLPFNSADLTPWIRSALAKDGIEIYALYILMFVNITSALVLSGVIVQRARKSARRAIVAVSLLASIIFCATVGFTLPINTLKETSLSMIILESLLITLAVFPLVALLYFLERRSPRWGMALAAMLIAPTCFIATSHISWLDYSYIFAPALRISQGNALSDIYFQYDLMLSLLAEVWMKLGLALDTFQVLGQCAYFLALLGIFLLSRKLFLKKELSVLLLAALLLARIYAGADDPIRAFQATPLRLDLWLPLLVLAYYLGPYHWSLGVYCGLLVLIHKNFGIIYSLAYLQLLLTLGLVGYLNSRKTGSSLGGLIDHGRRCLLPLILIIVSWVANHALFRNAAFANFADFYQKIGIGFLKIDPTSFYWYVPPILSSAIILLVRLRNHVSPAYLVSGFLLVYCAIGNSVYFFGRSAETNILNISLVLLFLFFFLLDLISRTLNEDDYSGTALSHLRSYGPLYIGALCILTLIVSYSHLIFTKAAIQIENAKTVELIYPVEQDKNFQGYMNRIRQVTGNSSKVYFIDDYDFTFYYYGGYTQVGYCNPFRTWIFTKDLNRFLQGLLDSGYYLVCNGNLKGVLNDLHYSHTIPVGENIVVNKTGSLAKP